MWPFTRRQPQTLAEKARRHADGLEQLLVALRSYHRSDWPELTETVKRWADTLDPMVREFRYVVDQRGPRTRAEEILIEMDPALHELSVYVVKREIPIVPRKILELPAYSTAFRESQHRGESL